MKRFKTGLLMCAFLVLNGCAMAGGQGEWLDKSEWFGIGVAGYASKPELDFAELRDSGGKGITSLNSFISFGGLGSHAKVPEEVEFTWKVKGESETHSQKMKLRSQIPAEVIEKLAIKSPVHRLSIQFIVRGGGPSFRWSLDALPEYPNRESTELARGGDWSK